MKDLGVGVEKTMNRKMIHESKVKPSSVLLQFDIDEMLQTIVTLEAETTQISEDYPKKNV
jgi:hypothetical protein